ncbi:hypothetical protein AK812_SmicGene11221 [Symbiodinium microadriaticum]|uniref:Uncharacterized protein n=1 Tax=Symbiodinium microadriaticum TaxID=2951 RepID=A0A1Q9EDT9_SYMMI|nr:hypothetical protein AK812_SmicGene11221 [Symbiodinium microadriaticum]
MKSEVFEFSRARRVRSVTRDTGAQAPHWRFQATLTDARTGMALFRDDGVVLVAASPTAPLQQPVMPSFKVEMMMAAPQQGQPLSGVSWPGAVPG